MTGWLSRTPLRVKLVAAVLVLVAVALVLISVASTVALRSYLIGQVDGQLVDTIQAQQHRGVPAEGGVFRVRSQLPSDYLLEWRIPGWPAFLDHDEQRYQPQDLPQRPADREEAINVAGEPYTVDAINGSTRWRVLVDVLPDGTTLIAAVNISDVYSTVNRLVWAEVLIGAGVLLLLATAGVAMVRTSLRPLHDIERTAGAIAAGDLTRRVPDPEASPGRPSAPVPRTEVGRLARALNAMLGQIEAAFAARTASEAAARDAERGARAAESRARESERRMRQFVADASHELRTPLTTIRGFAELYRQVGAASPDEAGRLVRRIEDEAARMGLLVEDLLLLARLDRERPLAQSPVELPVIVSDSVHAARAVDPDRTIQLDVRANGTPLVVTGDDARLRQVVGNLLSNALTHTAAGTAVTVRLYAERDMAVIEVADRGPGLSGEQAARVFERFYRVDSARTRPAHGATAGVNGAGTGSGAGAGNGASGDRAVPAGHRDAVAAATTGGTASGTGLGLAIVAALVGAHGGTVDVDSTPGDGATFRVRLPLAPATKPSPGG